MKLLAYIVNGNPVEVVEKGYNKELLNGNNPFEITNSDTIIDGYTDVSSIVNWNGHALNATNDYFTIKTGIAECYAQTNWESLTSIEKDVIIHHFCEQDSYKVLSFIALTNAFPASILAKYYRNHYSLMRDSCRYRGLMIPEVFVRNLIPMSVITAVMIDRGYLIDLFENRALIGNIAGDYADGIDDYINSTNGFLNGGLESELLLNNINVDVINSVINDLNIIIRGYYI